MRGLGILYIHRSKGIWWFRLFKRWGLQGKHKSIPPLFSEREGYNKYLHIGNWRFRILKP